VPTLVTYITDPASAASWGLEPMVRRLRVEFGAELRFRYVMGGLAREWRPDDYNRLVLEWLAEGESSRMPFDPLIWRDAPLRSSYPASMAVKAAADQSPSDGGYAYLRGLWEGIFCFRRRLDSTDALVDLAQRVGLDVARFRLDLASNASVEAFGNDLEIARGQERVEMPTLVFTGDDGVAHAVYGARPYEEYRAAAERAGAVAAGSRPGALDALRRFGRMATREVEEVCGLRGPRAEGELWQLALDFEVKPVRVLTGWLWDAAG
jgi:putative protein-disulfide isomerase